MNEGNKPCYCGSGKKFKKCHRDSKPRQTIVTYDLGKEVPIDSIRTNSVSGELTFFSKGEELLYEGAVLTSEYERPKKNKVLNRIPREPNPLSLEHHFSLTAFDLLLAIDTNTIELNGQTLSVPSLVAGVVKRIHVEPVNSIWVRNTLSLEIYEKKHVIALWNIDGKSENVGWVTFLQSVVSNKTYTKSRRVGLIVDSDLGRIDSYNSRTIALSGQFFLPPRIEMIYASSDAGGEFFAHKLIRMADTESKKWINLAKEAAESGRYNQYLDCEEAEGKPYTHFRSLV